MNVVIYEPGNNTGSTEFNAIEYELDTAINISTKVYNDMDSCKIIKDGIPVRRFNVDVKSMSNINERKTVSATASTVEVDSEEEESFANKIINEMESYNIILDQIILSVQRKTDQEDVEIEPCIYAANEIYRNVTKK